MLKHLRVSKTASPVLLGTPVALFLLTVLASLERTPLTGRWRAIILSTEEEDSISEQLQGAGWYSTVHGIIAQDGPVCIVPVDDWRYQWVQNVLRQLEQVIPILTREDELELPWLERGPDDIPLPPPSKHPLRPRFSAKEYIRCICDSMLNRARVINTDSPSCSTTFPNNYSCASPHLIPGPPYNLLLIERPDCDNAFSFGFGPNGAGGIVVYTGFLDNVLEMNSKTFSPQEASSRAKSFLAVLLGSFYPSLASSTPSTTSNPPPYQVTEEQNTQVAILLAHELAHLILAHHLETLSSVAIVLPGTLTILSDMLRTLLFPFTMHCGPFFNDAVAALGQAGSGEALRLSETCRSLSQEFEADAVSARILAHAGHDARAMITFWEQRRESDLSECTPRRAAQNAGTLPLDESEDTATMAAIRVATRLAMRIGGGRHPGNTARVEHLKRELQRWQHARERTLRKQRWKRMTLWQRIVESHRLGRRSSGEGNTQVFGR